MNINNTRKVLLAVLGLVVIALAVFFSGVIANSKVPYQPKKKRHHQTGVDPGGSKRISACLPSGQWFITSGQPR